MEKGRRRSNRGRLRRSGADDRAAGRLAVAMQQALIAHLPHCHRGRAHLLLLLLGLHGGAHCVDDLSRDRDGLDGGGSGRRVWSAGWRLAGTTGAATDWASGAGMTWQASGGGIAG